MNSEPSANPRHVEKTKQQIRSLVDEISALAKKEWTAEEYYKEFLTRVVEAMAAVGGAIWTLQDNQLRLGYQINLKRASLDEPGEHQTHHAKLLGQVIHSGEARLVPPHSGGGEESEGGANPTELLLVLAPLQSHQKVEAVVEIFQRPTAQPAARRGYLGFLKQMSETASEWLRAQRLSQLHDRESLWSQVDHFARSVHESLDTRQTAYTLANEAQQLIGCDRVSVAIRRGNKFKIEAVSGQDAFDNRSNVVTLLGLLATKVASTGEPLWYAGSTEHLPPQIEDAVHNYVDHSHTKTIAIIPLEHTGAEEVPADGAESEVEKDREIIAAVVVEQIEDLRPRAVLAPRVDLVCGHGARALTNAMDHSGVFLMPLWKTLGKSRVLVQARALPKTVAVAAVLLAVALVLCVVPGSFDLEGRGVIQPIMRRDVFVNTEGEVTKVLVKHGQMVEKGQVLAEIQNNDLDARLAKVHGELLAARERADAIRRLRHNTAMPNNEKVQLDGQLLEIQAEIRGLDLQYQLLLKEREHLVVRSPIDGQVTTWDVEHQLLHRPVSKGQVLMTVADPNGPWEMEIYMPENRMGHITQAREELGKYLPVEYIVATDPTQTLQGRLVEVNRTSQMHEEHGHAVWLRVDVDKDEIADPRPGATTTAKVHCGYRPLGYVWLHEAFEFVQSRVLFNLGF